MCIESGYKTITGIEFLNGISLLQQRRISFRSFRVYVACFSLVAIREAAKRAAPKRVPKGGKQLARYTVSELGALCGLTGSQVRADLRKLTKEELLTFSDSEIRVRQEPVPEASDLLPLIRSPKRPIPVPRIVLRSIAREKRASLSMAMIAYMLRGLTIEKKGGEISGKGSAKLSWIVAVTGFSERAVRYARRELITLGWISRDEGSTQWKLNRDGSYFSINLSWRPPVSSPNKNLVTMGTIAPQDPVNRCHFAAPYKDRKTPNGSKNQKASGSGVLRGGERELPPSIRNVRHEDLFSLWRCERLYWQAVKEGLIFHSECSTLNFLSAAVRARTVKEGDPSRIFVAIIRKGLWTHITCEQEEIARQALWRIREIDPVRFRLQGDPLKGLS